MESIVRNAINAALGSFILPLNENEFEMSRDNGFVLRDIIVDHEQLNNTLDKATDGAVVVEYGSIKELRINYEWREGTAKVELVNLSLSVAPRVGKMVKKKLLGCLDYAEPDADARRQGTLIYDAGWHPDTFRGPRYCPNCSYDLRPYTENRLCHGDDYNAPPRMIVSHRSAALNDHKSHVRQNVPIRKNVSNGINNEKIPKRRLQSPTSINSNVETAFSPPSHCSPPRNLQRQKEADFVVPRLKPQKKTLGMGCYNVIQNVRESIEGTDEQIPHPYMAPNNSPRKPIRGSQQLPKKQMDYTALADVGYEDEPKRNT